MVGPVKPGGQCIFFSTAGGVDEVSSTYRELSPPTPPFLSKALLFRRFLLRQNGGPGHDETLRRLINLIFACWITHYMIRQGLPLSTWRASTPRMAGPKGVTRVPPIRTHVVDWPTASPVRAITL